MVDPSRAYQDPFYLLDNAEERARSAWSYAEALASRKLRKQVARDAECIRLYEGADREASEDNGQTVTNCVQAVGDAVSSDLVRTRIKIQFLTEAGNWEERRNAQQISRACESQNEEAGIYGEVGTELARDGLVCPSGGAVKKTIDYAGNRVLTERIDAAHLLVDSREARMGKPQTLVYEFDAAPEVLARRYPQFAAELKQVDSASYDYLDADEKADYAALQTRRVRLFEIWHLPSSDVDSSDDAEWGIAPEGEPKPKPSHDGRHMLLCGPCRGMPLALEDEPWALNLFPVSVFRPQKRMRGWVGHSLAERLKRTQLEIDKYQDRIAGMLNLFSRVILYINKTSGVKSDGAFSNDWSRAWVGEGPASNAMQQFAPPSVPPDLLQRVESLIAWAKEFSGKSDLAMSGKHPNGIEAGVALRTLLDTDNARHLPEIRAWEVFHVELAKVDVAMWRLLAARSSDFTVSWGTDTNLARVAWRKIDLDNARFRMRPWPTSLFSSTPAAKLQQMVEIFQATGISADKAIPILASQFPDIAAVFDDENAFRDNIEEKLSQVVKDREVNGANMPHKFVNLPMACELALARFNALEKDGAPATVLQAVGNWIEAAQAERAKTAPPVEEPSPQPAASPSDLGAQPAGPAPAVPPGAAPGAAPLTESPVPP